MTQEKRLHLRGWRGRLRIDRMALIPPDTTAIGKNISAGGMLLETPEPLELGRVIKLQVTLFGLESFASGMEVPTAQFADDLLHTQAKVLRVVHAPTGGNWYNGVQFIGMPPEKTALLDKFVVAKAGGMFGKI